MELKEEGSLNTDTLRLIKSFTNPPAKTVSEWQCRSLLVLAFQVLENRLNFFLILLEVNPTRKFSFVRIKVTFVTHPWLHFTKSKNLIYVDDSKKCENYTKLAMKGKVYVNVVISFILTKTFLVFHQLQ